MKKIGKKAQPSTGKRGAPRQYDRAKVTVAICTRLATGEPMAVICRDVGVPVKTVNDWRLQDESIRAQFDEARDVGYDAIAVDCMRISDELKEDPASRRIRIETRLKLLARWDPRRYGERQQLDHTSSDGTMTPKGLSDFYAGVAAKPDDADS